MSDGNDKISPGENSACLAPLEAYLNPLELLPHAPDLFHVFRSYVSNPRLRRAEGGWFYKDRFYPDYLTVGGASLAIARTALRYCAGKGIDIGAGFWPLPGAIPVDPNRGLGKKHPLDEIPAGSLDFVFSSHCLEHIVSWRDALAVWVSKVKPDGIVFLYLPHPDCGIWEPGSPMVGDGHVWAPNPSVIQEALIDLSCKIIGRDDGPDMMWSFFVCARKSTRI